MENLSKLYLSNFTLLLHAFIFNYQNSLEKGQIILVPTILKINKVKSYIDIKPLKKFKFYVWSNNNDKNNIFGSIFNSI